MIYLLYAGCVVSRIGINIKYIRTIIISSMKRASSLYSKSMEKTKAGYIYSFCT